MPSVLITHKTKALSPAPHETAELSKQTLKCLTQNPNCFKRSRKIILVTPLVLGARDSNKVFVLITSQKFFA